MIATLRQNGQIISGLTKKFIWGTFIGNANIYIAKWIHYTSYCFCKCSHFCALNLSHFCARCSALEGCKYTTPKMSLLKAHECIHRKERNFKCNQCSKDFVEKSHLTRHEKSVHSAADEKPFVCPEEKSGCIFKTKRRDKLKDHLARIHGITQVPDNKGLKPSVLKNDKITKKGKTKNSDVREDA